LDTRITTVLLDFGGVLGLPQDPVRVERMASLCGLSRELFMAAYGRDRLELDRGSVSAVEYWSAILEVGGLPPTTEMIERLEREDALGWTRINRPVLGWAAELRAAGYRTGILSNMPSEKLHYMRGSDEFRWIADFDAALFSCDYKMVKPEPGFYRLCLAKLGVRPEECVFLDDSERNVEGARAIGIHVLTFRSAREAAVELSRTWGLPVQSLINGEGKDRPGTA
jgi:putative hydrolase of the HAD superfamily